MLSLEDSLKRKKITLLERKIEHALKKCGFTD